jgi:RimJ/RimL family protein N-acetyltransferase
MKVLLETSRLLLRELTEYDAENLLALDTDPDVLRYISAGPLTNAEAYAQRISDSYLPYYASSEARGFWAAVETISGAFLGWFCLRPGLDYRFAVEAQLHETDVELGYRLRRSYWGQGYATEGARSLVRMAFADPATDCVVAMALEANVASTRVMQKVGLKFVFRFALPGFELPAVKFALSRSEYST